MIKNPLMLFKKIKFIKKNAAKHKLLFIFIFIFQFLDISSVDMSSDNKNIQETFAANSEKILILYSYNYNLPVQQLIASTLQEAANKNNLFFGSLVHEYLDIPSLATQEQRSMLRDFLLKKYEGKHFKLIITIFEPATDFLLKDCKELSSESPCLSLFNIKRGNIFRGAQAVIQVPLVYDYLGTLEVAVKLFPKTHKILFVSGKAEDEIGFKNRQ